MLGPLIPLDAAASPSTLSTFMPLLVPLGILAFAAVVLTALLPKGAPDTPSFARRTTPPSSAQLRQDPNARLFRDRGAFLFGRRDWFEGTGCPPVRLRRKHVNNLQEIHTEHPARITQTNGRTWWWVGETFYWESGGYSGQDVLALVRARERKSKQQLDRAHMLLNAEQEPRKGREPIPLEMRRAVFERDGGQCRQCGERFDLQYDHAIPVALGGATSIENLQLLCGQCNRFKGADL